MNEQDAIQKWCPFALVAVYGGSGGASANRNAGGSGNSPCLASQCMAWHVYYCEGKELGYCGLVGRGKHE